MRQPAINPSHLPIDIPFRHGADIATGRRIARRLGWLTRGNPEPTRQQWQALGDGLQQGDPPMDRLAEWMAEYGMKEGWALFRGVLDHGIERFPDAPEPLRALFEAVEQPPEWLDEDLLAQGAQAIQLTGMTGLRVLRDLSLMGGYQASGINQTLLFTGSLSRGAQRRVAETTRWLLDCTADNGMARFGSGYKNTLQVRLIHSLIRRRVRAMDGWDMATWGLPINQTDMVATQLGFSVLFLIGSRAMGIPLSRQEGYAVMHLWRYIGWLMGVNESSLPLTEQQGRALLYRILLSQAPPDDSSRQLGHALMNEPLDRYYPNLVSLRGRFERARHLSIVRLFLDRQGMRDLGLPSRVVPWYPAMAAPINLARHGIHRVLPGGRQRLTRQGRTAQMDYLTILFGDDTPQIHSPEQDSPASP